MVLISLFFCVLSYINNDPIKSSFFLIFSMLFSMPVMSFVGYVWYSYFVSMLFLSGIFVILVYFSSLSSFMNLGTYCWLLGFFLTVFFLLMVEGVDFSKWGYIGLSVFYYDLNMVLLVYLVMMLFFFMSFVSYYLSFSGALRSL
uniref:NADH dehydrogenase subunit 6 n=1 Tax=Angiostrongylus costaricensis TaxID=334426 RepID=C7FNG4_ANGCS|nr:NADH dehydrogenase subunit 6 [Angiostrongylus costaricensis]ACT88796.1 NADH dehydrogenase subunit 6 [Angiostrongylus costaricensis]